MTRTMFPNLQIHQPAFLRAVHTTCKRVQRNTMPPCGPLEQYKELRLQLSRRSQLLDHENPLFISLKSFGLDAGDFSFPKDYNPGLTVAFKTQNPCPT